MFWRIFSFFLCLLAGSAVGWSLGREAGGWLGGPLGALGWFGIDLLRGLKVMRWLRQADMAEAPRMGGLWGEIADRIRRQLRARDKLITEGQDRLQEFLAALQASPNGVVLLDPQGRIEWCNQTAAQQFGFDAQRDLLQHIGNLVRDPSFTAYFAANDYRQDVIMPGRQHTPARPVKLSVNLHPYGQGRRLLLARDVTAVEQAEVMRRDFVANVSHEIRTPLTVLSGFVETLQTLPLDEAERTRYLALMAQQSQRMQTLVNDLLTLSRLEGSPLPGTDESTPVATLLLECEHEARALSALLAPTGHAITFTSVDEPVTLAGSHGELLSAMSNLTSNAVRYTPAGGRIEVAWRILPDGRGEFAVRDSGPGVAAEHLSRLTERFYRVDRSRSRETGGTGLGLAIVKHVVQRHGGELRIESVVGQGSTFSILFPAARIIRV